MSNLNESSQSVEKKIKITMTRRPPVQILPSAWPCVASADDKYFDNRYEFQANRTSSWTLIVRQHARGCVLVYGSYTYDSRFERESCYDIRGGERLAPGGDVVAAIIRVAEWMRTQVDRERSADADVFLRLANECIADLPAEDCDCDGSNLAFVV